MIKDSTRLSGLYVLFLCVSLLVFYYYYYCYYHINRTVSLNKETIFYVYIFDIPIYLKFNIFLPTCFINTEKVHPSKTH